MYVLQRYKIICIFVSYIHSDGMLSGKLRIYETQILIDIRRHSAGLHCRT